jgi:hypothetical protein
VQRRRDAQVERGHHAGHIGAVARPDDLPGHSQPMRLFSQQLTRPFIASASSFAIDVLVSAAAAVAPRGESRRAIPLHWANTACTDWQKSSATGPTPAYTAPRRRSCPCKVSGPAVERPGLGLFHSQQRAVMRPR